jgi:hypothetical protein
LSGSTYTLSNNGFIIPNVDNETNVTFYYQIILSDSTVYSTETETQLVGIVDIDSCGVYTNELINLTLSDEELFSSLTGKIYVNFQIEDNLGNTVLSFVDKNDAVHSEVFCSNILINETTLFFSAEIEYETTNYSREFYHVQQAALSDYPVTINLYNIKSEDSTNFKLIYQSSDLVDVESAVVQLQRKYTYLDEYKIVEAPLTSSESEAILHVDTDSVKYRVTIVKNGLVLSTFDNLVFQCDNILTGTCEINLLDPITPTNLENIESIRDFSYSISTNTTSKEINLDFSVPSSTPKQIQMIVKQNTIIGESIIYKNTITSAAGALTATYEDTIQDSSLSLEVFVNGELVAQKGYAAVEDLSDYFNKNNFLIVFIIGLSLIFMAMASPEWIILNSVLTIVGAGALWLINGMDLVVGLGSLVWIIGVAVILLLKTSKQEDN